MDTNENTPAPSMYTPLDLWWFRDVERRRADLIDQYPIPHDGASWVCMTNFFGVVGLADERIRPFVTRDVAEKLLELWPKRKTWFNAGIT